MAKKGRKLKSNNANGKNVHEDTIKGIAPRLEHWIRMPPAQFYETMQEYIGFRAYLREGGKISKKEALANQEAEIKRLQALLENSNSKREENEKLIQEKDAEVEEAEELVRKAREILLKKQSERQKLISRKNFLDSKHAEYTKLMKTMQELVSDMKNVILVHPSTSLDEIRKYQTEDIFISKTDAAFFFELEEKTQGVFSVDGVFDAEENERFVSEFPSDFFYKYSQDKVRSIKDYCEMVIHSIFEEDKSKKIIPLFDNNEDVEKILGLNGMEDYQD